MQLILFKLKKGILEYLVHPLHPKKSRKKKTKKETFLTRTKQEVKAPV